MFLAASDCGISAGSYQIGSGCRGLLADLVACLCARREPGCRPGGRGTFLCVAKEKYPKERRPHCLRPCASLRATCGARVQRGLARTRCAQTIASPDPLAAALLGAYRGDGEPNIQTATRAIAALGPGGASWRLMWLGLFLPTSSGWPPSPFG